MTSRTLAQLQGVLKYRAQLIRSAKDDDYHGTTAKRVIRYYNRACRTQDPVHVGRLIAVCLSEFELWQKEEHGHPVSRRS